MEPLIWHWTTGTDHSNEDGTFNMALDNWYRSAVHEKTRLSGTLLQTVLYNYGGHQNETCLNLKSVRGKYGWSFDVPKSPNDSILMSASCFRLSSATLTALCVGNDGMFHVSRIGLNDYYGNRNASFVSGDKHFAYTARNLGLHVANSSITLNAELRDCGRNYKAASVDLAICTVNKNGHLTFEKHDGWFDRDGAWTKFFEHLPVLGYVVAAIHAAAGIKDYAVRAIAVCTNSTIVCAGIVIGAWIGGPLGGVIGAGLATPIGILAEEQIAKVWEKNPGLKAQFEEATIGRNMVAAGVGGYLAEWLGSLAVTELDSALVAILKALGSTLKVPADFSVYALMKKIFDELRGVADNADWDEAIEMVERLLFLEKQRQKEQGKAIAKADHTFND